MATDTQVLSDPTEVETLLSKLFSVYAAERSNGAASHLSLLKYKQMAKDCGLLDQLLTDLVLELVFCSANRHKPRMQFQTFMNSLPRLAAAKWPEVSPHDSVVRLVNDYFLPLYVKVCGDLRPLECKEADPEVRILFKQSFPVLREIYIAYFAWEASGAVNVKQVTSKSQSAFFEFLRAFDICPQLISKSEVFDLWRELIESKTMLQSFAVQLLPNLTDEMGKVLTLGLFLTSLYLLSGAVKSKESKSEQTLELLQRMEVSQGFAMLKMRTHTPRTETSCLVPGRSSSHSVSHSVSHVSHHSLDDNSAVITEKYIERLFCLFQRYSSYGDQMNTGRLGSQQFVKLFRDCQLVTVKPDSLLFKNDLDLVFSKITGRNQQSRPGSTAGGPRSGKMDFQQFLKALEQVSVKLFPQLTAEEAYATLVEDYILHLDAQLQLSLPDSYFITRLSTILQDAEMLDALSLIHTSVVYYYHYFADPRGLLSFDNFMRFCRDFGVFPDICTKPKLLSMFNALVGIFSHTGQAEMSIAKSRGVYVEELPDVSGVIDEHLFVESLALISLEMDVSNDPPPMHRLCFLMEKLSQSGGPAKVMKGLGHNRTSTESQDLLAKLRIQYPDILAPKTIVQPSLVELLNGKTPRH